MSPHARGLHPEPDRVVHVHGIIPARAGFTTAISRRPATSWDHPRSRGVYWGLSGPPISPTGSSPLARGLRRQHDVSHARPPDHPRSRGVYAGLRGHPTCMTGSSPLARGLPDDRLQVRQEARIIPARAGFTAARAMPWWSLPDHPRSRGVYTRHSYYVSIRAGSSPFARGLLDHDEDRSGALLDHPRSRGVYAASPIRSHRREGSSPLARGLHDELIVNNPSHRIIPARAGFTPVPSA